MKKLVTMWIGPNEILIPAVHIPGCIADAIYPRPTRNLPAESEAIAYERAETAAALDTFPRGLEMVAGQEDVDAVARLKEERNQAKKLREKFPGLCEDYTLTKSEAAEYLAGCVFRCNVTGDSEIV